MVHDEEQQPAERGFLIDHSMVSEVIAQTSAVNKNLGELLERTDTCVRRQNVLLGLLILLISLMSIQLVLGFSMQRLQQSAKSQLMAIDLGREDLLTTLKQAKREVLLMRDELRSVPTVTADPKGRLNIEVPIDRVKAEPESSSEKLVIPLQPQRRSN